MASPNGYYVRQCPNRSPDSLLLFTTSTLNYSYLYKKIVQNRSRKPEELMVYRVILGNDRVANITKLFAVY
jgi:hypothetical protein